MSHGNLHRCTACRHRERACTNGGMYTSDRARSHGVMCAHREEEDAEVGRVRCEGAFSFK
jgi:hypothetical protein